MYRNVYIFIVRVCTNLGIKEGVVRCCGISRGSDSLYIRDLLDGQGSLCSFGAQGNVVVLA